MAIILANDGIAADAREKLEKLGYEVDTKHYEGEDLLKRLHEVDCIVIRSATKMFADQIDAAAEGGKLKLIIRAGVGMDNIDMPHAKEKGIEARNTPAASSNAVAELALAHIMGLTRHLHQANRSMAAGKWLKKEYSGTEIMGKTLGILGMGRIGRCLSEKAQALGMNVVYYDIFRNPAVKEEFAEFDEVLKRADVISLHMPAQGKAVLGKEEIAKCKDGVYLVNIARGGVIDEEALLEALDSGKVAGAALDCFSAEPCTNERLLQHDKISLTPHIGAATKEAQDRIGDVTVDIIQEVLG